MKVFGLREAGSRFGLGNAVYYLEEKLRCVSALVCQTKTMPVKVRRGRGGTSTSPPQRSASRRAPAGGAKWPDAVYDDRRGKLRPQDAYDVGKIIVEDLYQGERPEHGRRGITTFRKISQNMKGRMSAQALYRCAAIYEMCKALSVRPKWQHLGMSHLSLVLGLTTAQQKRLIASAEKGEWSVEKLRQEAGKLREKKKARKGRKPLPRFAKALHQLDRFVDGRESLTGDLDALGDLDRPKIKDMLKKVTVVQKQLASVQKELSRAASR